MPRYFFSLKNPAISTDDQDGEEYSDDAAAIAEAELVGASSSIGGTLLTP
jgi:hypothetical protein